MINVVSTKNLTGVTISGTHDDIYEIYEAIGKVMGPSEAFDLTTLRIHSVYVMNYAIASWEIVR